jgi:peptide/nickel transport system substrate-binding protein
MGFADRDGDGVLEDLDGNRLSLELITNQGNRSKESIAVMFAQEAANLGIEIQFTPIPYNALVERIVKSYKWQLAIVGLSRSLDPISGVNVYPSYGSLHMIEPNQSSPRRDWEILFDAGWIQANNTTDQAQRKKAFENLQKIWAEQLPWTYTYNLLVMEAYNSSLGNIVPLPVENYDWEGILPYLYYKSE